ncbi:MAG: transglycosylase SLT domain-containing protein [Acidobacteriales bacterium]|nr:transglycosylase SLT domain-containing protein [Terriglobales bacterium]
MPRFFVLFAVSAALWVAPFLSPPSVHAQTSSKATHKKSTAAGSRKKAAKSRKPRKKSAKDVSRLKRMRRAFVASETLKPMARQLLQDRTPAAYAGVEAYARHHATGDAGALSWLVLGYAHVLDRDYTRAIDPLIRAKAHAGDLGDYVNYYLANSYAQAGRTADAIAIFSRFEQDYPNSLLRRDAVVQYANALLVQGQAQDALRLLESNRQPIRSDIELSLGRAYENVGQGQRAAEIFRNLYFTMPISSEAVQASAELTKLSGTGVTAPPDFNERRSRADVLAKARHYSDAISEYRSLVDVAPPEQKVSVQLALAEAMRQSGQNREAKKILEAMPDFTREVNAQKLFNLGELARASDDRDGFMNYLARLRQEDPNSVWLQSALLSAGNMYLVKKDYDAAIAAYGELATRFPKADRAAYAQWKVAWLSLRQNRVNDAKQGFEKQIELYPGSPQTSAALYWRARLAQESGDSAMAKAFYLKLTERYKNYYYGELARQQLKGLAQVTPGHYPLLDHVPALDANIIEPDLPDEDDLRVQKARLLENGALVDFATREYRAAAAEDQANWFPVEIARMYQQLGRYDMALETLKRAVPNYFAVDVQALPRAYWEALFPKPFWHDLERFSTDNSLDPYLVASLIRQESEFNPTAVSHANAIGLMQLLPSVGKAMAKQEKIKRFNTAQLLVPTANLQLGTRYFRSMVDKFGSFEYALAAYNAGADRVQDWLADGKYRDPQEFVESIPFTETREYVQAILRNANMYRQLYGGGKTETLAKSQP